MSVNPTVFYSVVEAATPSDVDAVLVHVGTNHLPDIVDDGRLLLTTVQQHLRLVSRVSERYPGVPVLVSAIIPSFDDQQLNHLSTLYNQELARQIVSLSSVEMVWWDDVFPSHRPDYYSLDGLHPSRSGHTRLFEAVSQKILWQLSGERQHVLRE